LIQAHINDDIEHGEDRIGEERRGEGRRGEGR